MYCSLCFVQSGGPHFWRLFLTGKRVSSQISSLDPHSPLREAPLPEVPLYSLLTILYQVWNPNFQKMLLDVFSVPLVAKAPVALI